MSTNNNTADPQSGGAGEGTPSEGSQPTKQARETDSGQDQPASQGQADPTSASQSQGQQPSGETEDVPFNQHPRWQEMQEKMEEMEASSQFGQSVREIARTDPKFAVEIVERLEKAGKVAPGTTDRAREQLEDRLGQGQQQGQQPEQETMRQEEQPDISNLIESDPDLKFLKEKAQRERQEEYRRQQATEQALREWESDKPEITEAPNPAAVRQRVGLEADAIMRKARKQGQEIQPREAWNQAYKWVCKRDEVLEEYKEEGKTQGVLTSMSNSSSESPRGEPKESGTSLTEAEQRAMKAAGFSSAEEYRKYKEDPDKAQEEAIRNLESTT